MDTPSFGEVRIREDSLLVVDNPDGKIVAVEAGSNEASIMQTHNIQASNVQRLGVSVLKVLVDWPASHAAAGVHRDGSFVPAMLAHIVA